MFPDISAGRGSTCLIKSTPKRLNWLRTELQGVPGTSSMNFVKFLAHRGFQNLAMLFYQQESKSCTDSLKPITSDLLCIHAYKFYAITGMQPIIDKLARKRFFCPKNVRQNIPSPEELSINQCQCSVRYLGYNFLVAPLFKWETDDRKVLSLAGTTKGSRQPFAEGVVQGFGSYALPQLSFYRGSSHDSALRHHAF